MPIEGLSLGAVGAGAGWTILALVLWKWFRMIANGRLLTPREGDAMQRRIDKQDEELKESRATIAKFVDAIELNNDMVRAFLQVARGQGVEGKGPG